VPRLTRQILTVLAAAIAGAVACVAYVYQVRGNYEATAIVKYETSMAGFRRLANVAFTQDGFAAWADSRGNADGAVVAELRRVLADPALTQQAITPFFRVTKRDLRDMPPTKEEELTLTQLLGVELQFRARRPEAAAGLVKLAGTYLRDVALWDQASEYVRFYLKRYTNDVNRLQNELLRRAFETAQLNTKVEELRRLSARYPESNRMGDRQLLPVNGEGKTNYYLPPLAQIVGAESELVELRRTVARLERELEQARVAAAFFERAIERVGQPVSGVGLLQDLVSLREKVAGEFKAAESDAVRELVNQIGLVLSEYRIVFVGQPLFVSGDQIVVNRILSPAKAGVIGAVVGALLALLALTGPYLLAWLRSDPLPAGAA
jgi:hypothetical protein